MCTFKSQACADKKVYIYQLEGAVKPFRAVDTVLKMQTRCISAWSVKIYPYFTSRHLPFECDERRGAGGLHHLT